MYVCACMCAGALRGQQALDLPGLEPQVVVSHLVEVLGPNPGFSVIAVRTINSWVFLQPSKDFWLFFFFFFTLSMNRVSLFLGRVFPVVQACREFIMSSG